MGFIEVEFEDAAKYLLLNLNNLHLTKKRGLIVEYSMEDHR